MRHFLKLLLPLAIVVISFQATVQAQDAELVRAAIERHYVAINAQDYTTAMDGHLPDFTYFAPDRPLRLDTEAMEASERMGASLDFGLANVYMTDFKAQIYGEVAVATFYLVGTYTMRDESVNGTWRVTAIWVWDGDGWKEAHHHESALIGERDD